MSKYRKDVHPEELVAKAKECIKDLQYFIDKEETLKTLSGTDRLVLAIAMKDIKSKRGLAQFYSETRIRETVNNKKWVKK